MEYFKDNYGALYQGDVLEELKKLSDESVNMCVTSPPYWCLRNYELEGQIGLENTPEEYIDKLVEIFREVRRVLKKEGTLWLNVGDSYYNHRGGKGQALVKQSISKSQRDLPSICPRRANKLKGLKDKDLIGIPWMLAFALRSDGWYLRQDNIWSKPNCQPESVRDRCTKSHEYFFLLSKSKRYYYDYRSIREAAKPKGNKLRYKNKRSVWSVRLKPFRKAHFSVFPPELIKPCILAGCPEGGVVLDPFIGSGTTAVVSEDLNRKWLGVELGEKYCEMVEDRVIKNRSIFIEFNISLG